MKRYQKLIISIILVIITVLLTFLFYKHATGQYTSDLPLHIYLNASSYSILQLFYKFIINYLGGHFSIAIFLALVELANILLTKKVLKSYMKSKIGRAHV